MLSYSSINFINEMSMFLPVLFRGYSGVKHELKRLDELYTCHIKKWSFETWQIPFLRLLQSIRLQFPNLWVISIDQRGLTEFSRLVCRCRNLKSLKIKRSYDLRWSEQVQFSMALHYVSLVLTMLENIEIEIDGESLTKVGRQVIKSLPLNVLKIIDPVKLPDFLDCSCYLGLKFDIEQNKQKLTILTMRNLINYHLKYIVTPQH